MNTRARIRQTLLLSMLLLTTGFAAAQQNLDICSEKPRLVLMILVDNLNNEQLEIVRSRASSSGLNRIYHHGTHLREAHYDAGGNYAGKNLATLFTGAPAATHGIVSEQWIDHFSNQKTHAVYGSAYDENGRIDTLAEARNSLLLCSTIGNEIRKIYNDQARIVSIGFDEEKLLWTSGGGVEEGIAWFDARSGGMQCRHMSSDSATWIAEFNSKGFADACLDKIWAPKEDIVTYHEWKYFSQGQEQRTFYYPLAASVGEPHYARLCGSPQGNTLMRDFAVWTLLNTNMGKDDIPDLLTIQFSSTPSVAPKQQPLDAETEDLLLCLDDNISSLLKVVDEFIGMDNTLVVFSSIQGTNDVRNTTSPQWKSRGAVSLHRTTALLNLYLMALHGQGQWVRNYSSCAIYLNKELAAERQVKWDTLMMESCDFLVQVKGIANAVDASRLQELHLDSPVMNALRRNYHPKRSGDILICLEPGWAEEQDDGSQLTQGWGYEFVPLAFYGWKVPRATIYDRHNITDVAPTICSFIRIPQPDGCSGTPIPVVRWLTEDEKKK